MWIHSIAGTSCTTRRLLFQVTMYVLTPSLTTSERCLITFRKQSICTRLGAAQVKLAISIATTHFEGGRNVCANLLILGAIINN